MNEVPGVAVSVARPPDSDDVLRLIRLQFDEHAIAAPDDDLHAAIAAVLADDRRGAFFLARDDGRAIGVAYVSFVWALEHCGRGAWLEELYVLPERRCAGIGNMLLQETLSYLRRRGCTAIDLEVEHGQKRAANLYRRAGFKPLTRARWVQKLM